MSFLQFLSRGRRNRGLEMDATLAKKQPYLAKKNFFLQLNFQDERHSSSACLFYVISI